MYNIYVFMLFLIFFSPSVCSRAQGSISSKVTPQVLIHHVHTHTHTHTQTHTCYSDTHTCYNETHTHTCYNDYCHQQLSFCGVGWGFPKQDRKSTRLNSSHT